MDLDIVLTKVEIQKIGEVKSPTSNKTSAKKQVTNDVADVKPVAKRRQQQRRQRQRRQRQRRQRQRRQRQRRQRQRRQRQRRQRQRRVLKK